VAILLGLAMEGLLLLVGTGFGGLLGLKPREFESLTSAVQSQSDDTVAVRRCSKTLANSGIPSFEPSWLFAIARML
jgi:hypothetical protein